MSIPEKYKVEHLFLLVGENPLPNYVAAHLLLNQPDGIIYLVHTTGTEPQADRLRNILGNDGLKLPQLMSLGDYESDAYHIQKKLREKIINLPGKLGLNYTGGTKAMAVHAYRAFLTQTDTVFSYLDSRELEMCIDNENGERIRRPVDLQVPLETLLKLHIPDLKNPFVTEPTLPNIAKVLVKFTSEWRSWLTNTFEEQAKKPNSKGEKVWTNKSDFRAMKISMNDLPQEIIDEFRNERLTTDEDLLNLENFFQIPSFAKSKDPHKKIGTWLDGTWLEDYVLQQIIDIASTSSIHDYGMSFNVPVIEKEDFEFDVAFMQNHQLFALSCTTSSDKKLCKSKLFEAYIRAKQMGGDEARIALVCCYDNPESLKSEMTVRLKTQKITVFGREDLPKLKDKIANWIKENE